MGKSGGYGGAHLPSVGRGCLAFLRLLWRPDGAARKLHHDRRATRRVARGGHDHINNATEGQPLSVCGAAPESGAAVVHWWGSDFQMADGQCETICCVAVQNRVGVAVQKTHRRRGPPGVRFSKCSLGEIGTLRAQKKKAQPLLSHQRHACAPCCCAREAHAGF